MRRIALLVVASVTVTACASDDPGGGDDGSSAVIVTTTTEPAAPASTSPAAATSPPTETAVDATTAPADTTTPGASVPPPTEPPATTAPPTVGDPRVAAQEVGRFDQPVDLVVRPGDEALYVVQQRGQVVRWHRGEGTSEVVLDVAGRLAGGGEQGLLGLAFSPDGATAYVDFTALPDGTTTIAEYAVADDGVFAADSERIVLTVPQPYSNHNAGDLHVDADGLLYVTLGDGGSGGDPERLANDPTSLLGSLLRIDPSPRDGQAYSIPPDNPFAGGPLVLDDGSAIDGAPEVFAWGLRNPWKIAFDPVTGELWIPDVGQNQIEEVNVVGPDDGRPAGWASDFGWSAFEGTTRFNADVPATDRMTPPVLTYEHGADGCSVTGGVPYRGTAIPELEPAFVYSDYCSGLVWALDLAGVRNLVLLDGFEGVTAIRADAAGELYVLESGGGVHQLVPG